MKILIADDHPVVRHGLKQILTAEPDMLVVGEAKNGNEAMELARKLEWDVAILDFSMPGRSGLQLLGEIKREFPQRRVLKAGGAGYMNKESAGEELAAAIRKVVGGGKYVSASLAERLAVELTPDAQKPPHETLSDREYRVMWLLASGKPINQIAKEMFLSPSTISTYRVRILKKLGLATNAELVHYTVKHQLIE
jgi:two-component system, NarL family, invasion response regulator UvrY